MKSSKGKIVVIGAGFVGATTAYAICQSQIASELVLIDVNHDKAVGEALDLNHGLSLMGQMKITAGDYSDCKGADIIVVTAGANRKPGETRLDLARKNVSIMGSIIPNIMEHYDGAVIVNVSNPVDVLTYMIQRETGIPSHKVIGSGTVLDTSRLRYILSERLGVDVNDVHAMIIGEHGDSAVPVWSKANISGTPLDDFIKINALSEALDKEKIYNEVQQSGATVIKNKGATYYAIALSVTKICKSILKNESSVLPVGALMNGKTYGGITDVVINVPCIVNGQGISKVLELPLSKEEMEKFTASANKLKETIAEVL